MLGVVADRSADWIRQARRDLDSPRAQLRDGYYEWACFISQQAAEKALKAALQTRGSEAWGHSLVALVQALGGQTRVPEDLAEGCRLLDRYYVTARYPNGWPAGGPSDYIAQEDGTLAVGHSEAILRFCAGLVARP